jgi:hypothetical protein
MAVLVVVLGVSMACSYFQIIRMTCDLFLTGWAESFVVCPVECFVGLCPSKDTPVEELDPPECALLLLDILYCCVKEYL